MDGSDMFPLRQQTAAKEQSQEVLVLQRTGDSEACDHEWQTFKQTIEPSRTPLQEKKGYLYKGGRAYFIVRACVLCHIKRNIKMKVEYE